MNDYNTDTSDTYEDRIEHLQAETKALKKRAEAAEKGWQLAGVEIERLEKWQIKPTEAICLTDLSCRYKKVFKSD